MNNEFSAKQFRDPRAARASSARLAKRMAIAREVSKNARKPLRIMKFGGTSVGNVACIESVVEIIRTASRENSVVVVVSAMSGVTNRLIEAATQAEAGNREMVAAIFEQLRQQHRATANGLIACTETRDRICGKMEEMLHEGERLCLGAMLLRELTLRTRDSISSLGERLCAPLLTAALGERGLTSAAIEATELIVTDSCHGSADPWMDLTRERCVMRLGPLMKEGVIPVVTGFIGATAEGVLTTLGRGGSDYSATILGAALEADEVIIWTDVDGLATSDPRLVPGAGTISEVSYREAAELAYFGAKVLHPKTLRPVMQSGIPLWIRNTFAPERPGTKITPDGPRDAGAVTALAAISEVAMILVGGPAIAGVPDVLSRTFATMGAIRAEVLLISQSSSQNEICLVVPSAVARGAIEALRREFAQHLAYEDVEHITLDSTVAMVTIVGRNIRGVPGIVGRTFGALGRQNVKTIAIAQGSSECSISFVVAREDMKAALITAHQELELGEPKASVFPVKSSGESVACWLRDGEPSRLLGD